MSMVQEAQYLVSLCLSFPMHKLYKILTAQAAATGGPKGQQGVGQEEPRAYCA